MSDADAPSQPPIRSPGFAAGMSAPIRGAGYLRRRPELWKYAVLPLIVNLIVTTAALAALLISLIMLVSYIAASVTGGGWGWIPAGIVGGLGLLGVIWLFVPLYRLLNGLFVDYFYGILAERIELDLGVDEGTLSSISWAESAIDGLRDFLQLSIITIGLAILAVIPGIGAVLALLGTLYFNAYALGREPMSYPLDLRGRRLDDKRAFFREHRRATIGLGLSQLMLNLIPIVGPVWRTCGVAGAVLLHRDIGDDPAAAAAHPPPPGSPGETTDPQDSAPNHAVNAGDAPDADDDHAGTSPITKTDGPQPSPREAS